MFHRNNEQVDFCVLFLGLDGSGKTSILNTLRFRNNKRVNTKLTKCEPTVGYDSHYLFYHETTFDRKKEEKRASYKPTGTRKRERKKKEENEAKVEIKTETNDDEANIENVAISKRERRSAYVEDIREMETEEKEKKKEEEEEKKEEEEETSSKKTQVLGNEPQHKREENKEKEVTTEANGSSYEIQLKPGLE
ncbi:erythrocyte binding protein, partial [Reticulomyxa filosa]